MEVLKKENILLGKSFNTKEAAIEAAGNILVKEGYVTPKYVVLMQEREKIVSTYVGNHVAVPHGVNNSGNEIQHSGISIVQVPEGVSFEDEENEVVYVLFGIAGKNDTHLELLGQIAVFCSEEENVQRIREAKTQEEIIGFLQECFE